MHFQQSSKETQGLIWFRGNLGDAKKANCNQNSKETQGFIRFATILGYQEALLNRNSKETQLANGNQVFPNRSQTGNAFALYDCLILLDLLDSDWFF